MLLPAAESTSAVAAPAPSRPPTPARHGGGKRREGMGRTASRFLQGLNRDFRPCIYILASRKYGTLYIGVTSDLSRRIWAHREGIIPGFTKRYGVKTLVYYEFHVTMYAAITREKQIKEWRRSRKIDLIETMNPEWRDLYSDLAN
jgi:putative endonuclease